MSEGSWASVVPSLSLWLSLSTLLFPSLPESSSPRAPVIPPYAIRRCHGLIKSGIVPTVFENIRDTATSTNRDPGVLLKATLFSFRRSLPHIPLAP